MFFHLTTERYDNHLLVKEHQYSWCDKSFKPHILYLDENWGFYEDGNKLEWHKSYTLTDKQKQFCIIRFQKSECRWTIGHNNLRDFPIYYTEIEITNIPDLLIDPVELAANQNIELKDRVFVYTSKNCR